MSLLTTTKQSATVFDCDPSLLYDILTDYDTYAEWLPLIAQSKSLAKEGDLAIAEFELPPPQKEKFVIECIHTRNKMVLWRTIGGTIPISQVEWTIAPSGEGHSQVTLAVLGRVNWTSFVPRYRQFLNPSRCLKALQSQISTVLPEIALSSEEGEKILELSETDQGVVCWIRGKKYILKPDSEENHD